MRERSQGALEYLIMLGAILVVVAGIVSSIYLVSHGLGSNVGSQIDNTMENVVIPGLVGMSLGAVTRRRSNSSQL